VGLSGFETVFVQKARFMIVFEQVNRFYAFGVSSTVPNSIAKLNFMCSECSFLCIDTENNHFYAAESDFDRYSPFVVV